MSGLENSLGSRSNWERRQQFEGPNDGGGCEGGQQEVQQEVVNVGGDIGRIIQGFDKPFIHVDDETPLDPKVFSFLDKKGFFIGENCEFVTPKEGVDVPSIGKLVIFKEILDDCYDYIIVDKNTGRARVIGELDDSDRHIKEDTLSKDGSIVIAKQGIVKDRFCMIGKNLCLSYIEKE